MGFSWTCPYCNRPCTIGSNDITNISTHEFIAPEYERFKSETIVIVCPNKDCRKHTISLRISQLDKDTYVKVKELYHWQLVPESSAKPFPDYIPLALRNDYEEACLIKNKSPKASATLSRRCLQGMVRDFWGIKKKNLFDEIAALEDKVDATTWEAIDSVRKVGNIGAHMEKNVNLIIDVDSKEAGLMIWLIETLFEEWYIARHDKEQKMKALVALAQDKKKAKQNSQQDVSADS